MGFGCLRRSRNSDVGFEEGRNDRAQPLNSGHMCNLHVEITGWNSGFRDLDHFRSVARKVEGVIMYDGDHIVLENGCLDRGKDSRLHTYFAKINVEDSVSGPHLHLAGGSMVYISDVFPSLERCLVEEPHYTLSGLYETLPDNGMDTRIDALNVALSRVGFEDNSIATHKEVRLKLLEGHYRRLVSDQ